MEHLLNEFMHLYFWVWIAFYVVAQIINWGKPIEPVRVKMSLTQIISTVLFIMSFKY